MSSEELQGRASHAIEVDEKTRRRYDRKKAEMDAADPNLPDMSDGQFMKCLLDTLEAVDEGFYAVADDHLGGSQECRSREDSA